jgi:hypothetical protein
MHPAWTAARWVRGEDEGVKYLQNLGYALWFPKELQGVVTGDVFEELACQLISEGFCRFSKLHNMGGGTPYNPEPLIGGNLLPSAKGRRHAQTILHQDEEFIRRFGENPEYEPGSFLGRNIDNSAMVAIFKNIAGA